MSLHKEFFGFLFLAFVGWIFMASTPNERIERVCAPTHWVGNGVVSVASLLLPAQQVKVQRWFDKVEYGCRYITWRLVYQDEYNAWLTKSKQEEEARDAAASQARAADKADAAKSGQAKPEGAKPAEKIAPPSKPGEPAPTGG